MLKPSRSLRVLFFALIMLLPSLRCSAAEHRSPPGGPYWKDYYGSRVAVYQCGLYCAAVQLSYVGIDFDLDMLRGRLDCSDEGTSLLSLKEVFEAHGLSVDALESITVPDLLRYLKEGRTAVIVATMPDNRKHLLPVLRFGKGSFFCVDGPAKCRVIPQKEFGLLLKKSGGVGLILSASPRDEHVNDLMVVAPSTVDVGDLSLTEKDPKAEFVIENRSSRTTVITQVRAACGCTSIDISTKWLPPGQSTRITLTMFRDKWGADAEKKVYVHFANGAIAALAVKGKGLAVDDKDVLYKPSAIYLTEDMFGAESSLVRKLLFKRKDTGPLEVANVKTNAAWVSVLPDDKKPQDSEYVTVCLKIDKMSAYGVAATNVEVVSSARAQPITIPVRQERPFPFQVSSSTLHLIVPGAESKTISVSPIDTSAPFEILSFVHDGETILAQWTPGPLTGKADVVFRVNASMANRWHAEQAVLRVKQRQETVDIPIRVLIQNDQTR